MYIDRLYNKLVGNPVELNYLLNEIHLFSTFDHDLEKAEKDAERDEYELTGVDGMKDKAESEELRKILRDFKLKDNKPRAFSYSLSWKYVNPLKDESTITKVEEITGVTIPDEVKNIIMKYNGGRPPRTTFDLRSSRGNEFKTLLSFNRDDVENVFEFIDKGKDYVPIASDPAGNLICIKSDGSTYFWNHELDKLEKITDSFTKFLNSLY